MRITAHSYAKINLYLDVLNRRRDGYTNIETIFQTISLSDTLTVEHRESGIVLECSVPGLPTGPGNLVFRAARLLREAAGFSGGAAMRLEKRIPVAAGLAGGSGNAAAALLALNRLWRTNLPAARLERLALALGSDVPYCLRGGTVAATGRGQHMTPLTPLPETWFVTVHPAIKVSTRAVYTHPALERSSQRPFAGRTAAFRAAIAKAESGQVANVLFNRMQSAAFVMYPELADWKERLAGAGCQAVLMSGSGPTLFGLCRSRAGAEAVVARFGSVMPCSVVRTVPHGVVVEAG